MTERDKQIIKDYQKKKGLSLRKLGEKYGISHTEVANILKKNGIERKPVGVNY